jgi:hypothetical protein
MAVGAGLAGEVDGRSTAVAGLRGVFGIGIPDGGPQGLGSSVTMLME